MKPENAAKLTVVPLELREANEFVESHHRHHKRVQGHRFSIGALDEAGRLVGCAIVGRPTSGLDPKRILEVTRMCSDGTPNACSFLYAAAARVGKSLGYEMIQTYIYDTEPGTTLRACGWKFERAAHPSGRHRARTDGSARNTDYVDTKKTLWVCSLRSGVDHAIYGHHRTKVVN